ncbi:MAG: fibrillarin-like rRNA/tRNA 2'-O-methyltransferase [Methanosphaera sp.]|nr:fibrillarin-like rRNA/tRNA 2'-O-methyltransferase [Methanosphaera sp.]
MQIRQMDENVYQIDNQIATVNLVRGKQVYHEKLLEHDGIEYRLWSPHRSKLAASIMNGLSIFPFKRDSTVLYLGASAGTTPSHISDICVDGKIYSVEFSPIMMRELLEVSHARENILPILSDATRPHEYQHLVESVDIIYSDVAQPKQTKLFIDNFKLYAKENTIGIIIIKARSIDVTMNPNTIFKQAKHELNENGLKVIEEVLLDPYEKDHILYVCEKSF